MGIQRQRFAREDRLLRRAEFQSVVRYGRRVHVGGVLLVAVRRQERDSSQPGRLGITVSRRVGKAVLRNQLKRWIREWFRSRRSGLRSDLDVVVVVRRGAVGRSHDEVIAALEAGARAMGALR